MELLEWFSWFALLPTGGVMVFGGLVFMWARTVVVTRRRVWLITLLLSAVFFVVEIVLIYKFAYVVPE